MIHAAYASRYHGARRRRRRSTRPRRVAARPGLRGARPWRARRYHGERARVGGRGEVEDWDASSRTRRSRGRQGRRRTSEAAERHKRLARERGRRDADPRGPRALRAEGALPATALATRAAQLLRRADRDHRRVARPQPAQDRAQLRLRRLTQPIVGPPVCAWRKIPDPRPGTTGRMLNSITARYG